MDDIDAILNKINEKLDEIKNEEENIIASVDQPKEGLNVWDNPKIYKCITIEEFIQMIKDGKIGLLNVGRKFIPGDETNSMLEIDYSQKKIAINYTDNNHPITIPTNSVFGNPSISKEYFKKYEKEIKEAFLYAYKNIDKLYYNIDNSIFSPEILDILLEKENATLHFYNINFTPEQLNKIHSKFINVYLNHKQINSRHVISFYTMDTIKKETNFTISFGEIKDCIPEHFKYLNDNSIISLTNWGKNDEEEYLKSAFQLIEEVDKLNKKLCFKISVEKRSKMEKYIKKNHFKNIKLQINNDLYEYPYQEYIEEEKILDSLIEPIKKENLSPLEKYIAVYNIVKNFKPYKENKEDKNQSRYLRYILRNDYMVCVGYAKLLECLLDKVGIKSTEISVMVDTSYDNGFDPEKSDETLVKEAGHARVVVNMEDDKYNIHGLYMADPTWDNDLDKDYLNHALMTFDNMIVDKRMFFFNYVYPLLSFHSFEEFSRQVNYLLKHEINRSFKFNKNKKYEEIVIEAFEKVAEGIIKNIDCDERIIYFKDLLNNCKTENDYNNLFTELGHYLLVRLNKPINMEIITQANDVVRKRINGMDTNTARIDTEKSDKSLFPYQVPEDNDHNIIARK